jgi:HEAT repeat protein
MACLSAAAAGMAEATAVELRPLGAVEEQEASRREREHAQRAEAQAQRAEEQAQRRQEAAEREAERAQRVDEQYERGTEALDERRWEQAIEAFDRVVQAGGRRADGALYWKAYALHKAGRSAEALSAIGELRRAHASSRWLKEAGALELEVRQAGGQAPQPAAVADEDLKLMALNALMNTDAEQALPMLEKFLQGTQSPKLRERALFVLSQSGSPQAREIVGRIARGQANPDLQRKAIHYLGLFGGEESRQVLSDVYAGAAEIEVKKAILRSFMVAGERDRVMAAAKGEKEPELRREAIQQLGVMGAQEELWQLYGTETTPEVKKAILQAFFVGGGADRLMQLARTEKDPELRRRAVRNLGLMGEAKTAGFLVEMYRTDSDASIRRDVIEALFVQGNAKALVEIARAEKDPEMKKHAVSKLALMSDKGATEFLMEILNK